MIFKKLIAILALIFTCTYLNAQIDTIKTNSWQEYFEEYNKKNVGYNYIYCYNTIGGEKLKSYHYFKCNDEFILTYQNFNDSTFNFLKFKTDTLFKYLEQNFGVLKKFYKKYRPINFTNRFNDRTYNMIQIGIRFKDLHFNHFQPISDLELSEMPIENEYTKGQTIINELANFFEKIFKK